MKTSEQVRERLKDELITAIEVKAEKYEDEEWRTGIPGAMLKAALTSCQELIEWFLED